MRKPTEAASDGRGPTAAVLQFPALVSAPVKNIRWHGCYPRGVSSLNSERFNRNVRAAKAASSALQASVAHVDQEGVDLGEVVFNARFVALLAEKLVKDIQAVEALQEQ